MQRISEEVLDNKINQKKELFKTEILSFKEVGENFVKGEISSNEFKASSGGMGVYAQKGGKEFMIRLRVLCGKLDYNNFKLINDIANDFKLDFIHLTTRQAIQLHNLSFDNIIKIMDLSLINNLFTRGGGGNFPRNVSLSPLSGVEKNEEFDVTKYAILANKFFVSRIQDYKLPRKFKVAFSNNDKDSANARIADVGFIAKNIDGEHYFKLYAGGSLGNQGEAAVKIADNVRAEDILYHIEAAVKLLVTEGDYENKAKARMRFVLKRLGREGFINRYNEILAELFEVENLKIEDINLENYKEDKTDNEDVVNLIKQKQSDLYTVIIHPLGGILYTKDLNKIWDFLKDYKEIDARIGMEENLYIRNLTKEAAYKLLGLSDEFSLKTKLEKSVSCIGVPTCQIGIAQSQKLLKDIVGYFKEREFNEDILPSLSISGCLNSCARQQSAIIGFNGKKKKVNDELVDVFTLHTGAFTKEDERILSKERGDIKEDVIPEFLYDLAILLKSEKLEFSEFIETKEEEFIKFLNNYLV
jgi:ferredoxin-nitrite reductase